MLHVNNAYLLYMYISISKAKAKFKQGNFKKITNYILKCINFVHCIYLRVPCQHSLDRKTALHICYYTEVCLG